MISNTKKAIIQLRCPVGVFSALSLSAAVTVHNIPIQIPDPKPQMPYRDVMPIPTQADPTMIDNKDKITSTTGKYFMSFHKELFV